MKNLSNKVLNFSKATLRLQDACKLYDFQNDIVQDSIIQRFEFTFTVAVSALRAYMENQGVVLEETFPRSIFKLAYTHNIIDAEEIWLSLLLDRNMTSHIYDQTISQKIAERIVKKYLPEFQKLVEKLNSNL